VLRAYSAAYRPLESVERLPSVQLTREAFELLKAYAEEKKTTRAYRSSAPGCALTLPNPPCRLVSGAASAAVAEFVSKR
jgi:hypothetical protein